jgi:hypothetical protein
VLHAALQRLAHIMLLLLLRLLRLIACQTSDRGAESALCTVTNALS